MHAGAHTHVLIYTVYTNIDTYINISIYFPFRTKPTALQGLGFIVYLGRSFRVDS